MKPVIPNTNGFVTGALAPAGSNVATRLDEKGKQEVECHTFDDSTETPVIKTNEENITKLVDAAGLLDALFDAESRPSLRWARTMQAQKKFPFYKLGHLVRFDVGKVRKALEENFKVNARTRI